MILAAQLKNNNSKLMSNLLYQLNYTDDPSPPIQSETGTK